jgi:rhamnose transport system substrate-binding protein
MNLTIRKGTATLAVLILAAACSGGAATPRPATPPPATAVPATAAATTAPATATAAATAAPATATAAATSAPASAGGSPTGEGPNIVFIPKAINNPYFDAAAVGAQTAADELGGQFENVGPSTSASDAQVPFITDETTAQVDAIGISASDPDAIVPALTAAREAGIKVVGYDSSPAVGAYDVFVNQTDFSLIGAAMAKWACQLAPDCTGEIAILSATATAPNQNAWIADMQTALTENPDYANLDLVDTVYGNDEPEESASQATGLLTNHPDLKVIVAPTTVGILAAAQVVSQTEGSTVKVTGLGLPNDMREFVTADGITPIFGLWAVPDLGYLAYEVAAKLVSGEITGAPGETFSIPAFVGRYSHNGDYTIGEDSVVILGDPFEFTPDNIAEFDF